MTAFHPDPDWLPDARRRLNSFATLPSGWDSYGAARPDPAIIRAADEFLMFLLEHCEVPEPYVAPTAGGGVFLEWEMGQHSLELDVGTPNGATYVYENSSTGERQTGQLFFDDADDSQFLRLVRACIANQTGQKR